MSEQLLTTDELAARLAVSPKTVVSWAREGLIPEIRPSRRLRRFDYDDVVTALKAGRKGHTDEDS
jgi:excisionase family DNA binding protein